MTTADRLKSTGVVVSFVGLLTLGYLALDRKQEITGVRMEQPDGTHWRVEIAKPVESPKSAAESRIQALIAKVDPYDRKQMAANRAKYEAEVAAGTAEVNTSSMAAPHMPPSRPRAIEYTINASLTTRRFNLILSPNVRAGEGRPETAERAGQQDGIPEQLWLNPGFRALVVQVNSDNRFPVRIQRVRRGVMTPVTTLWVQAGPKPSSEQFQLLRVDDWQDGDVMRIPIDSPALLIERDAQTGQVVIPHLSGVEVSSGDSTPIPGVLTYRQ